MNRTPFTCMLLFLAGTGLVIGCSKQNPTANISGTVTYNGAPIPAGDLVFHTSSGVYSTGIQSDGTYSLEQVPVGEAVVTVNNEQLNPNKKTPVYLGQKTNPSASGKSDQYYAKKMGTAAAPSSSGAGSAPPRGAKAPAASPAPEGVSQEKGAYVKLPNSYADQTKSKLKVNLTAGSQTVNLELKD